MQTTLRQRFVERYGHEPKWFVRAPGRVNVIGDHTDYNDGFVLPMAIDHAIWMAAAPRSAPGIRVYSVNLELQESFGVDGEALSVSHTWTDYLKGVVDQFQQRGMAMPALDLMVMSAVPMGCGLSSSAALQLGIARLLQHLDPTCVPDQDLAALCQSAEHAFTGMPAGIMDQFCVAYAQEGHLMFLDCRSLDVEHIAIADPNVSVLIINSKVSRELRDGAYARRRATCEEACGILGVSHLRDVTPEQVDAARDALGELRFKRARHVTTEDARTRATVAAIQAQRWQEAGELMHQSHLSLSQDYETSVPELDALNAIAHDLGPKAGLYGARITGGGFGGCAVALIQHDRRDAIIKTLFERYKEATGLELETYSSSPSGGAQLIA
ncbi:MAG: galactokinase [Pseudomonadota bacterium]